MHVFKYTQKTTTNTILKNSKEKSAVTLKYISSLLNTVSCSSLDV